MTGIHIHRGGGTRDVGEAPGPPDSAAGAPAVAWDVAAFEALFRAQYGPLCGFVRRLVGTAETAEELVQDVFAGVWAQRQTLDIRTSVKALLCCVL